MKKSILFLFVLVIGISTGAQAQFSGGDGSEGNPYQVATAADLNDVRNYLSSYFIQTADIDLDMAPFNTGSGWEPVGTDASRFTGTFDGDGFTISNLYINRAQNYTGLFGYTDGAAIKNTGLTNVDVTGGAYTGGLAGYNENGSAITNSYATGTVSGGSHTGGLAGYNTGSSTITNSYAEVTVSGEGNDIGGLAGTNYGSSTITNSYAAGTISGSSYTGGLVGNNSNATITNSYAVGAVSGGGNTGGLAGYNNNATITSSYWNTETSGQAGSAGGTGLTTYQMRQEASFTGFDFNSTWSIDEGLSYPWLQNNVPDSLLGFPFAGGAGTEADPLQIATGGQLELVRDHLDKHFILTADIDLNISPYNTGSGWEPVGTDASTFTGTFDGDGFTISNLYINRAQNYTGLFGFINGAAIKNTGLTNVDVTGGAYTGGLAGYNENGSAITNSYATGTVSGGSHTGGLAGYNIGSSTITNSYADVTVSGEGNDIGGLAGTNYGSSTITNSYAAGTVSGDSNTGGLVGYNDNATVTNSYWNTETSGQATSDGGTGLTTAQMRKEASFTGFDFNSTWSIDEGLSYPWLQNNVPDSLPGFPFAGGAGTEADPFQIAEAGQLDLVRDHLDKHFILTANIDLNISPYNTGSGWEPVGTETSRFTGTFDGNGFTISNLYINRGSENDIGLFGLTAGATIKNTGLTNVDVTGEAYTGGLVGAHVLGSTITNSYAMGTVSGGSRTGGLVGWNVSGSAITNSYAAGTASGNSYTGGLVGENYNATITNSYAAGTVSGGSHTGGLAGYNNNATITSSYWNTETSGQAGSAGGTGLTTYQMRQEASFTGFDFNSTWSIDEGLSYPWLQNNVPDSLLGFPFAGGAGTEADPLQIVAAGQLDLVRDHLDKHFILTADIDLNISPFNTGSGWEPVGTEANPFTGTFDGDGFTISNLYINRGSENDIGLFGLTAGATIKNTGLTNVDVSGGDYTGGLVGSGETTITNSFAAGTVSGGSDTGGLAGYNGNGSAITNSYAEVTVSGGGNTGGLVGNNSNATITNSYAAGTVSGDSNTGGLAGYNNNTTVTDSYWNTETSGQAGSAGGTGLTTAQMRQQASFTGFDFNSTWDIDEGLSYPWLQTNVPDSLPGTGIFAPTVSASNIIATVTGTSATIKWTPGNGAKRIVYATASSETHAAPVDGTTYPISGQIIYNGTGGGDSVNVSSLLDFTQYTVRVYEYNSEDSTHKYLVSSIPSQSFMTTHPEAPDPGTTLIFSGNEYVEFPYNALHNPSGAFTVEFWAKPTGGSDLRMAISSRTSGLDGYQILIGSNDHWAMMDAGASPNIWNTLDGPVARMNEWQHIAAVYKDEVLTFYVDGVSLAQASFTHYPNPSGILRLGGFAPDPDLYRFVGELDEFRIWSVARTQEEIKNYMFTSLAGNETGLNAYWKFDEGSGDTAYDYSSNNNNGTLSNTQPVYSTSVPPAGAFINGTEDGWYFLSNPAPGVTLNDFLEPLWTQGATGSDSPDNGQPNVFELNEITGAYQGVTDLDVEAAPGKGYLVRVYKNDVYGQEGTFPKKLSTTRTAKPASKSLPVSYTEESLFPGFSLVGNPHPNAIDLEHSGWQFSNMSPSVYLYDETLGDYRSYNRSLSIGNNGGTRYIAPLQGFLVEASAAGAELSLPDSAAVTHSVALLKQGETLPRIQLEVATGERAEQTQLVFHLPENSTVPANQTLQLEPMSHEKLMLYSLDAGRRKIDVAEFPEAIDGYLDIPIGMETTLSGEVILKSALKDINEEWEVFLLDKETGTFFDVRETHEYTFITEAPKNKQVVSDSLRNLPKKMKAASGEITEPRFLLRAGYGVAMAMEEEFGLPKEISLHQNYPNPFNPSTTINFELPAEAKVSLEVFDILGRKVATLFSNETIKAGRHAVRFNARELASGMYLYRFVADNKVITKKLMLIK